MSADTATADAFADGQREAREADRRALVAALGLSEDATWAEALSYAMRHAEDNTDPTLQGMCRTSNAWMQTAAMHARNEDYYRGLLAACSAHLGPAVYVQDDGGIVTDPLLAKVPELVAAMRQRIVELERERDEARAELDALLVERTGMDSAGWEAEGAAHEALMVAENRRGGAVECPDCGRIRFVDGGPDIDLSPSRCQGCEREVEQKAARDEAREEGRRAGLEEAANTAFDAVFQGHTTSEEAMRVLNTALAAIRALAAIARESEPAAPVTTIYDVEGDL